MFQKMPVILILIIALATLLDSYLPLEIKSILYAVSLSIKATIVFVLPVIVFMLLFKALAKLANSATRTILFVLLAVCCSNFISTMISYQIGRAVYQFDLSIVVPDSLNGLAPAWTFVLPKLIPNQYAMFGGLILGLLGSKFYPVRTERISLIFDQIIATALKAIVYLIPIFITGFAVKLIHDRLLQNIIKEYSLIFALVAMSQLTYIGFLYFAVNRFQMPGFVSCIKNMLPAALAGFSSMSSAASMPITLIGAEKNTQNPNLARLIVPTTVNVHLIGCSFAIPIFAFAVLKNFQQPEPTFWVYLLFALSFVMAKFSVAAIPGGGILVMLPILESQMGFTSEMLSLITALYILLDPMITCANILGNGAFAIIISRSLKYVFKEEPQPTPAVQT